MKIPSKLQQLSFIIHREFLAISTSYAVLLVLIGGIFVYGLLYNYMYAPNIVAGVSAVVIDNSHSELSRDFIRWLDATPQVEIFNQVMDYHKVKEWMKEGKVQGVLYLPHDFEERVFRGDEAVSSLYATIGVFLHLEALQDASSRVMLTTNDEYRPDEAVFLPPQGLFAVAMAKLINVEGTVLHNYTEGYNSYLIPAVMIIIIFQTLLMVIGMVTGEEYSNKGICAYTSSGYGWGVAIRIVAGKTSAYCAPYAIFVLFLLGLLPHFFSISNIGNGLYIVLLLIPYLMATSFLGLAASRYFTDSEVPLLMIAFFSVGLIFPSDVSYPMELMPRYWKVVHYISPAAPGILAFMKFNLMGASTAGIRPEYITLWIQALVYLTVSIWVYKKKLESNLTG